MRDYPSHSQQPDREHWESPAGVLLLSPVLPSAVPDSFPALLAPSAGGRLTAVRPAAARTASAADLAHDARSLISAIHIYCELLTGPGVLAPRFRHYAEDLRRVGETGARLIEAMAVAAQATLPDTLPNTLPDTRSGDAAVRDAAVCDRRSFPWIEDLAAELETLAAPLRALAGPGIRLEVECGPCAGQLGLNPEDLLRILFNLVANAAEAMTVPSLPPVRKPFLRITAQRGGGASFLPGAPGAGTVVLSVRDNGPGIAGTHLERVFEPGFSVRPGRRASDERRQKSEADRVVASTSRPATQPGRGLGLAIVRGLVENAGGAVRAVSTAGSGTRIDIELPLIPRAAHDRGRAFAVRDAPALAYSRGKRKLEDRSHKNK